MAFLLCEVNHWCLYGEFLPPCGVTLSRRHADALALTQSTNVSEHVLFWDSVKSGKKKQKKTSRYFKLQTHCGNKPPLKNYILTPTSNSRYQLRMRTGMPASPASVSTNDQRYAIFFFFFSTFKFGCHWWCVLRETVSPYVTTVSFPAIVMRLNSMQVL